MTEAPEPVWDRIASESYICALGRVVYEANRLETVVASRWYEYAHMAGEYPHEKYRSMAHAMASKRNPADDLIKILTGAEPTERVRRHLKWAEKAKRLSGSGTRLRMSSTSNSKTHR